jgi:hypothetical protein
VTMFPLAVLEPVLNKWQDKPADAILTARHRHIESAVDLPRHRYFRDHLYAHASMTMATKFQMFDDRSLATVKATTGLRILATDSELAPYIYYWCRPTPATWPKTHGVILFSSRFAPPPRQQVYTTAAIDHSAEDWSVQSLSRPVDVSAQRTPEGLAASAQNPGPSAILLAMLHTNALSPPTKRKRRDSDSTPAITGTSVEKSVRGGRRVQPAGYPHQTPSLSPN